MHIVVDGSISVREGHEIADKVENSIISGLPEVVDVVVHVDPSEDSSDNSRRRQQPDATGP
jgi:divalent metal cation (Fe/Co/Zn/Cd) transporter